MQAQKPSYKVTYNGVNITEDISKNLLSLNYTDKSEGESDDLELSLEDVAQLWQNEWYPSKGATLLVSIGIEGGQSLDCGEFMIDEIELTGPPDVVNIRGLSAGILGKKRTRKGHPHENKTLSEIVHTVAAKDGYTVQGNISNIRIGRVMQQRETDLQFLNRLAIQYGYIFNLRGKTIIFTPQKELESTNPTGTYDKTDLISYSFNDKSTKTYRGSKVIFHNPAKRETIVHEEVDNEIEADDVLVIHKKAEDKGQAEVMAKAALYRANSLQQTGNITLPGATYLVSGNAIELTGLGLLSGKYYIMSSTHTVNKGDGWIVECEIKKVGVVDENKYKPKTN